MLCFSLSSSVTLVSWSVIKHALTLVKSHSLSQRDSWSSRPLMYFLLNMHLVCVDLFVMMLLALVCCLAKISGPLTKLIPHIIAKCYFNIKLITKVFFLYIDRATAQTFAIISFYSRSVCSYVIEANKPYYVTDTSCILKWKSLFCCPASGEEVVAIINVFFTVIARDYFSLL